MHRIEMPSLEAVVPAVHIAEHAAMKRACARGTETTPGTRAGTQDAGLISRNGAAGKMVL